MCENCKKLEKEIKRLEKALAEEIEGHTSRFKIPDGWLIDPEELDP